MVSALAITGIRFTLVPNLFIISTSRGLTLILSLAIVMTVYFSLRSSRLDKVETGVNPQVLLVQPVWLLFLPHVRFMLVVDKVDNRGPADDQFPPDQGPETDLSLLLT